jgi:hypothetical protein
MSDRNERLREWVRNEEGRRHGLDIEALLTECRQLRERLNALTSAANAVLAFHAPPVKSDDEVSRPLVRLRAALEVEAGE